MVKTKEIMYKDLDNTEKIIFNDIDFMLVGCKVNKGVKSLNKIMSVLKEKYK